LLWSPTPNPQTDGLNCSFSIFLPYLEVALTIRNLPLHHAVMTRDSFTVKFLTRLYYTIQKKNDDYISSAVLTLYFRLGSRLRFYVNIQRLTIGDEVHLLSTLKNWEWKNCTLLWNKNTLQVHSFPYLIDLDNYLLLIKICYSICELAVSKLSSLQISYCLQKEISLTSS